MRVGRWIASGELKFAFANDGGGQASPASPRLPPDENPAERFEEERRSKGASGCAPPPRWMRSACPSLGAARLRRRRSHCCSDIGTNGTIAFFEKVARIKGLQVVESSIYIHFICKIIGTFTL